MLDPSRRVGVVAFCNPRAASSARGRALRERHESLVSSLRGAGLTPVDAAPQALSFGVRTAAQVRRAARLLREAAADCLVIGCWDSADPALAVALVRELAVPVALYTEDDPEWAGTASLSAIGAALWESAVNHHALRHRRIVGDVGKRIAPWARGVCALADLRRSALLIWDDPAPARRRAHDGLEDLVPSLVGGVREDERGRLASIAQRIRADQPHRVEAFLDWVTRGGARVTYDEQMLTPDNFAAQAALLLAARDRLGELGDEAIAGVAVGCRGGPWRECGVTPCLLPAFLPFGRDSEGERPLVPTVCGADVKGLATSALLALIEPGVPPLCAEVEHIGEETMILGKCGGASVYYAAYSADPAAVLPRLRLSGCPEGAAGAAVAYDMRPSPMTIARLVRMGKSYLMHLGRGVALEMDERIRSRLAGGQAWPHALIYIGVPQQLLVDALGSGHYCAMPGDLCAEMEAACEAAEVPVLHLDSLEELSRFGRDARGA